MIPCDQLSLALRVTRETLQFSGVLPLRYSTATRTPSTWAFRPALGGGEVPVFAPSPEFSNPSIIIPLHTMISQALIPRPFPGSLLFSSCFWLFHLHVTAWKDADGKEVSLINSHRECWMGRSRSLPDRALGPF